MISLNLKPEVRESYTDQALAGQLAQATGGTVATTLAAIEACAGLYERSFASADSPVLPAGTMRFGA